MQKPADQGERAGCPTLAELDAFVRGAGTPETTEHVSHCAACGELVARLRDADGFLDEFRSRIGGVDPPVPVRGVDATIVPGYRIEEEVRRGAQGIVYRAVQERTKRTVAIKMLLGGAFATGVQRARFEREAEIAAGLKHPNIVTVHDSVALAGGRHAFVMEYIEGLPLDQWTPEEGEPVAALRRKLGMFAGVCAGVQHAHLSGVIHRDLKPSNVLVDAGGVAHVLDFGIARRTGAEITATLTGSFAGTPAYASPEQFAGRPEQIDARTDVYSLGVMLYELVSGRLPYAVNGSMREIVDHVTTTEPEPPSAVTAASDRDLDTIILRALQKDPARRYQSAGDLGADIGHYVAGEAIQARRDSVWYVVSKAARRRKLPLVAAVIAILALGGGVTALAVGLDRAREARRDERIAERGARAQAARVEAVSCVLAELAQLSGVQTPEGDPIVSAADRLADKIEAGIFQARPEVEASIRELVAELYERRVLLDHAELQRRRCVRTRREILGPLDTDTARAEDSLAVLLASRGRPEEALAWAESAASSRDALPANHPDRARSVDTLARVRLAAGDATEAESLAERAAAMRRASLGPEDPAVAESLLTVARARLARGDGPGALDLCRRALAIQFRTLPDGAPAMWEAFGLLESSRVAAQLPQPDGRYGRLGVHAERSAGEAVPPALLRDLVVVKREALGAEAIEAYRTHLYVGILHVRASEFHDAAGTLEEVLQVLERISGPDAPLVGVCLSYLSTACAALGLMDEALAHAQRSLAITRAHLSGVDDRAVALATLAVADLEASLGRDASALTSYRQGTELLERAAGPAGPDLGLALAREALAELAGAWDSADARGRAAALARRAVGISGVEEPIVIFASAAASAAEGGLGEAAPRVASSLEGVRPLLFRWSTHRRVARRLLAEYERVGDAVTRDALVAALEGTPGDRSSAAPDRSSEDSPSPAR